MILHYIPKDQLRQHWDYIKNGLEIIRSKGHTEWIVEDVYCDCYEGRSLLYIGIIDNKAVGFVVLQPTNNSVHIWATWSSLKDESLFQEAWKEVQLMAKHWNKPKISFTSVRRGWDRRAKALGFVPSTWDFKIKD